MCVHEENGMNMDYTELGKTGLRVSVAGLRCGGNSRIGLGRGASEAEAVRLVRAAIDEGVNFLDTAEAYGNEHVVGRAVAEAGRDRAVIATKCHSRAAENILAPGDVEAKVDAALKRLGTDYVDVFNLHAVTPDIYPDVRDKILPVLLRIKETGKIRHVGITESAPRDPEQRTLGMASTDGSGWEVMMLAYSMGNFRADGTLLPTMRANGIGSLLMFVVRNIFSQPAVLAETIRNLADAAQIDPAIAEAEDPLSFLVHENGARTITDAAYRFARHESGGNVVLFGTGSIDHLKENVRSINSPPLPADDVTKLRTIFGGQTGIGLDLPDRVRARSA